MSCWYVFLRANLKLLETKKDNYVYAELKTNRVLTNERQKFNFESYVDRDSAVDTCTEKNN